MWQIGGHYQGGILLSNVTPLLLDAYPNAYTAYSFRKLRTAYAGSAVRIRRSSDNAEADIGFSGFDFDTAAAAAHIGGGSGFIVTWYDQSGNGINVTQATSSRQPLYVASGFGSGSKPNAFWNSSGSTVYQGLVSAGNPQTINTTTMTVAAAFNLTATVNSAIWTFDDTGTGDAMMFVRKFDGQLYAFHSGAAKSEAPGSSVDGIDSYAVSIADGANHTMYVNGVGGTPVAATGSIVNNGSDLDAVRIGLRSGDQSAMDGEVVEVIAWTSDQTGSRAGIEANIDLYWGL